MMVNDGEKVIMVLINDGSWWWIGDNGENDDNDGVW